MEERITVAIIGLGRVGTTFLQKLTEYKGRGITIVGVTEKNADSPGLEFARKNGIAVFRDTNEITALGAMVDVIFNLTGDPSVERNMKLAQAKEGNHKTAIVSTVMASLLWKLISEEALPQHTRIVQE